MFDSFDGKEATKKSDKGIVTSISYESYGRFASLYMFLVKL